MSLFVKQDGGKKLPPLPPGWRESIPSVIGTMQPRMAQITEITQYCDLFSILNQIGALPTVSPSASGMPPVLVQ